MTEIGINVKRMATAMIKQKGEQFTIGYLEASIASLIKEFVKDEAKLQELNIRFLAKACECLIGVDQKVA